MKYLIPILFSIACIACNYNTQQKATVDWRKNDSLIATHLYNSSPSAKSVIDANTTSSDSIKVDSVGKALKKMLTTFDFDFYDDTAISYGNTPTEKPHHWSETDDYFAVYQFSKSVIGIGFDLIQEHTYIDSLFTMAHISNDSLIISQSQERRTNQVYALLHNSRLKEIIFNNDTARYFYIYCTKGVTIAKIEDVVCNAGPCVAFLVLQLSHIDTEKYGHPVIASKKYIKLNYSSVPAFQHDLNIYEYILKNKVTYKDRMISNQFAYNDSLFFTYSDDFDWWRTDSSVCKFPSRWICRRVKNHIVGEWSDEIDLFGISCD